VASGGVGVVRTASRVPSTIPISRSRHLTSSLAFLSPSTGDRRRFGLHDYQVNGAGSVTGAIILWKCCHRTEANATVTTLVKHVQLPAPVPASLITSTVTVQLPSNPLLAFRDFRILAEYDRSLECWSSSRLAAPRTAPTVTSIFVVDTSQAPVHMMRRSITLTVTARFRE